MKTNKTTLHQFNNILIIVTRRIGDVLLATPIIHSLKQAYPHANIDVLVFNNTQLILEGNPDIRNIITVAEKPDFTAHLKLIGQLFRKYDLALTSQYGDKPFLYAYFASKYRIGMINSMKKQYAWKRNMTHHWTFLDDINTHTVIQNLKLLDGLNIEKKYQVIPPQLTSTSNKLDQKLSAIKGNKGYFVIHPYPMYAYKQWHEQGWHQLIQYFAEQSIGIAITGGPATQEVTFCTKLVSQAHYPHMINFAGQLSLAEVTYVITNSLGFIGPDTSVTHIAAACNVPVITLFGPSNPVKWDPWPGNYQQNINPFNMRPDSSQHYQQQDNIWLLQGNQDCVPCFEEGCDRHLESRSQCLDQLPTATVIDVINTILSKK